MTPPPLTPTDATSSPQPLFDLDRSHFSEVLTQTNAEPAVVLPEDHSLVDEYFNLDAYENDCASSHTPSKLKDLSTRDSLTFDLAYPLPAFDWNGYPSLIGFGDAIGFASQPLTITAYVYLDGLYNILLTCSLFVGDPSLVSPWLALYTTRLIYLWSCRPAKPTLCCTRC